MKDVTKGRQAEDTLRNERDNLKNILKAMRDCVYIVNRQFDIQYANPAMEKEFGNYKDLKCYKYFHDRVKICPWCPNSKVFAGETVHWEWSSFKNGKTYALTDTPIKNSDGIISKLEIFHDITESKIAEKELNRQLIEKQIDDFQLNPKRLIPVGIIVNELLTNVMKYAFTDRT